MQLVAFLALLFAVSCECGSGPYLPRGWKPDGPAFYLPGEESEVAPEVLQPENNYLTEYGPPKDLQLPTDQTQQPFVEIDGSRRGKIIDQTPNDVEPIPKELEDRVSAPEDGSSPGSPADLVSIPEQSSNSPGEASTTPAATSTTPAEASTTPAAASTTPAEASTTPAEASTTPSAASTTSVEVSTTPAESSTVPAEASTAPAESSTTPAETSTTVESSTLPSSTAPADASTILADESSTTEGPVVGNRQGKYIEKEEDHLLGVASANKKLPEGFLEYGPPAPTPNKPGKPFAQYGPPVESNEARRRRRISPRITRTARFH